MSAGPAPERLAQVDDALSEVRRRIGAAATAAARDPAGITLVAVTKTFPASDVAILAGLGVTDVGENRDQEAAAKYRDLVGELPALRWHLVGQLQTNKARSVATYAHAVHSLDRAKLVNALSRAVVDVEREDLEVFVQVSLDGDVARGGAVVADVPALADAVAGAPGLRLVGVMAVAPRDVDPDAAFAQLAAVGERVRARHPDAHGISAGMSGDLEAAITHGATHVRVGSALLGSRPPVVG